MEKRAPSSKAHPGTLPQNEQAQRAASCPVAQIRQFLYSPNPAILLALLNNPNMGESEALLLLKRRSLPVPVVEKIASRRELRDSYAIKLALAQHPRTPPRIALEALKFLYVFDLVSVCLLPGLPPEIKSVSEQLILAQVKKLAIGQRITLAKRGPARVAAGLLTLADGNSQIVNAVLENPYLTERALLEVLNRPECPSRVVDALAMHEKWALRYDLRLALLRKPSLTMARALKLLSGLKAPDLKELSQDSSATPELRRYVANLVNRSAVR